MLEPLLEAFSPLLVPFVVMGAFLCLLFGLEQLDQWKKRR